MTGAGQDVFVNYRRADTGWAATAVADALRRRLPTDRVFLDNSSIALGRSFAHEMEVAVRGSAVLLALIGPAWDRPPAARPAARPGRLGPPRAAARPRAVDPHHPRPGRPPAPPAGRRPPRGAAFPHRAAVCRAAPGPSRRRRRAGGPDRRPAPGNPAAATCRRQRSRPPRAGRAAPPSTAAGPAAGRQPRPPARPRHGRADRRRPLVYLAPARLPNRPAGSATALVTTDRFVVVDVEEDFRVRGEIGIPLARIARVQVTPTLPMFADVVVHTVAGDQIELLGMFRDQARRTADHIRGG